MLKPIDFEVNGEKYQALPHTGFEAMNLDRKVTALFSRVSRKGSKNEADFYEAVTEELANYSDDEYRWLVETTFNRTTVLTEGKPHVRLADMDAIADQFRGKGSELYGILIRIWSEERLTPFVTAQAGENGSAGT